MKQKQKPCSFSLHPDNIAYIEAVVLKQKETNHRYSRSVYLDDLITHLRTKANVKIKSENHSEDKLKDLSAIKDGFDHWWALYPKERRKNKKGCLVKFKSKFKSLKGDEIDDLINQMSNDITKRVAECTKLEFIPMTEPYLNQERWNDGQ